MENQIQGFCEKCNGTGWQVLIERGISSAKRCECSPLIDEDKQLTAAKIPPRYAQCEFDNYLPQHVSQTIAKKLSGDYAFEYPMLDDETFRERSLLFTGGAGRGKTHLAVAVLKGLARKGIPCLFVDFHELLAEIRHSYDELSKTSEFQILAPVLNVEVLCLDDLGSQRMSEWVQDTVFHIINLRYGQKKTLIATSNLRLERAKDSHQETLEERLGYRVVSRLYEMCTFIEIEGPDYRKDVRKAGGDFMRSSKA